MKKFIRILLLNASLITVVFSADQAQVMQTLDDSSSSIAQIARNTASLYRETDRIAQISQFDTLAILGQE